VTKIVIEAELEFDASLMYGDDVEGRRWFFEDILGDKSGLILHSNEIGDEIGVLRILRVTPRPETAPGADG
jgi:hypothetical protein